MAGPLSHIRVLDLSHVLAGPWSTQMVRDIPRPDGTVIPVVSNPLNFSKTPLTIKLPRQS